MSINLEKKEEITLGEKQHKKKLINNKRVYKLFCRLFYIL